VHERGLLLEQRPDDLHLALPHRERRAARQVERRVRPRGTGETLDETAVYVAAGLPRAVRVAAHDAATAD
jgi:hypothetical protein